MRLRSIELSWFRGAASQAVLETGGRSLAVYGPNGSGKTSFVDGLEFVICAGRIVHLAHEYSGRRLERAVPNTHAPPGTAATVRIALEDGSQVLGTMGSAAAPTFTGRDALSAWSLERLILRQDRVAAFIAADKGTKYSALLPVIGLETLETAATNLRALAREVERLSRKDAVRQQMESLQQRLTHAFPDMNLAAIGAALKELHRRYLPDDSLPESSSDALGALKIAIDARLNALSWEEKRHGYLLQAQKADLAGFLLALDETTAAAAETGAPLLRERLCVLKASHQLAEAMDTVSEIDCPACGQRVRSDVFRSHVAEETFRLEIALRHHAERRACLGKVAAAVAGMQRNLEAAELAEWRKKPAPCTPEGVSQFLAMDAERLRDESATEALLDLRRLLPNLIVAITAAAAKVPAGVEQLMADRDRVLAAAGYPELRVLSRKLDAAEAVIDFLAAAEVAVREEIRAQTEAVLAAVSADVARMWAVLHPAEPIDGVHLYQHEAAEKAIDVGVRFYGKVQPSPRLALSEGHRNSLGLCVFLALAIQDVSTPLVLDDVVTSFDREHRSYVVDLLVQEFPDRQILLFTHDYEWFLELDRRLPRKTWGLKALLPFDAPAIGIRWSGNPPGFEAARALLEVDAMAAANKARGLMDLHAAMLCERLAVPVPYMRGSRNDLRHALDLLQRLKSRADGCMRKSDGAGGHIKDGSIGVALPPLLDVLASWANAASHGREVTRSEAGRLIELCEKSLGTLVCTSCKTHVSHARVEGKHLRCDCDMLRWTV